MFLSFQVKQLHMALLQIQASQLELKGLKEVVKCVTNLKLEQKFPVDYLVSLIQKLEKDEENRNGFSQMKKRNSSSTCASVRNPAQRDKRPRVEHAHRGHQVAPQGYTTFPQPSAQHATHQTPNVQPARQIHAFNTPGYNNTVNPHFYSGQFMPPGMQPAAHFPSYYGKTFLFHNLLYGWLFSFSCCLIFACRHLFVTLSYT